MAETQINNTGVLAVRETFKYDERGRITEYDNNKGDKKISLTVGVRKL